MGSDPAVSRSNDISLKRMIDVKKHYLNARKGLMGNLLGDDLGALENLYEAILISMELLAGELEMDTGTIDTGTMDVGTIGTATVNAALVEVMAENYRKRYNEGLRGTNSVISLLDHRKEVRSSRTLPSRDRLNHWKGDIEKYLDDISRALFGRSLDSLDYHLIIDDDEMRDILVDAQKFILSSNYKGSIMRSSLAFSISLEKMRQHLNFLMENDELSTHFFSLDSKKTLYYKLQDYFFILLALEVDMKKYQLFIKIVPTTLIDDSGPDGVSVTFSDYIHEKWLTLKWARFCFNFVVETLLHWGSMELSSQ